MKKYMTKNEIVEKQISNEIGLKNRKSKCLKL